MLAGIMASSFVANFNDLQKELVLAIDFRQHYSLHYYSLVGPISAQPHLAKSFIAHNYNFRPDALLKSLHTRLRVDYIMSSCMLANRLLSRKSFLDSTEALNTSKQDARTTLWVEEWNALGERSTEWRDRGIIQNEHLASGTDEPWSTWRSLNRLRVQKGRCRAMMKIWKLSHTDVCDRGERQTMSHLMTCGDAPNCTGTDLAMPNVAGVNSAKHWEESI